MAHEIVATFDGEPCDERTLGHIARNIAAFELRNRPLDACRVTIESCCRDGMPSNDVCARVAVRCSGAAHDAAASCAVRCDLQEAIDAAFEVALIQACRSTAPASGAPGGLLSGHVVQLSPGCEAGLLETDDGRTVEFAILGDPNHAHALHIGDRAWIMQDGGDHGARELVFQDHGKTLRAWLGPCP